LDLRCVPRYGQATRLKNARNLREMAQRGAAVGGRFCPSRAPCPSKVYLVYQVWVQMKYFISILLKRQKHFTSLTRYRNAAYTSPPLPHTDISYATCHIPQATGHRPQAIFHNPPLTIPYTPPIFRRYFTAKRSRSRLVEVLDTVFTPPKTGMELRLACF